MAISASSTWRQRHSILERAVSRLTLTPVLWAVIGLAVAIRLRQYLANRSLWLDEAMLAPNLIHRSFAELWRPLENSQAAPIGFLFAEHAVVSLFGSSEYALRLFPLLCGLVSIFLFWMFADRLLTRLGVIVAVALFAVSAPLVYYASETKQYSSDVAIALLLYCLTSIVPVERNENGLARWTLVAIAGAFAIWFSHPAIFVLGAIGARWLWRAWNTNHRRLAIASAVTCTVWAASFASFYLVSLHDLAANTDLQEFHHQAAAPLVPTSSADFVRYGHALEMLTALPLGPSGLGLVSLAGLLGGVALFRRQRDAFCWVLSAGGLAWLASSFGKYPLVPRLWLFMAPGLLLFVAAGVEETWRRTQKVFPLLSLALLALLVAHPVLAAGYHMVKPAQTEEIRPLLEYIRQNRQDGDVLYLYYGARDAARYYAERGLTFPGEVVQGVGARNEEAAYVRDVHRLRGKERVWVLFSHVYAWGPGLNEERLILYHLDGMGRRLDARRSHGASAYLYDLR